MHYVIGDVHGCLDDMLELIDKIEKQDDEAQFIFVGDFIDRGPKIWETLTWVMENISKNGKYQAVRGNHEQMLGDFLYDYACWYGSDRKNNIPAPEYAYDTFEVMKKHITPSGESGLHCPEDFEGIKNFIESLPYNKLVEVESEWGVRVPFRIVHATHAHYEKNESRQIQNNLWGRNYCGIRGSGEIIVHGHTPTVSEHYIAASERDNRPGLIGYRTNDINVDGGCTFSGVGCRFPVMLCAIRLEDLEEFYPYTLEERYAFLSRVHRNETGDASEFAVKITKAYSEHFLSRPSPNKAVLLEKLGFSDEKLKVITN